MRLLEPGYRLLAGLVAAALTFISSSWLPLYTRTVLAWNAGITVLLGLIAIMMWQTGPQETLRRARKEEVSNIVILLATILAVSGALVDIGYSLPNTQEISQVLRVFDIADSVAGVFLSWLLLHVIYSLHYAKIYYEKPNDGDGNAFRKGLEFPGNDDVVDYWDFVYYSFTIAMCFQTSDVTVTSPHMRRLTIFHATVSYIFALTVLGLLLSGFVSKI
jgi:uncharacterized membrane protein